MKTIKIDIKDIPKTDFPCLDYCKTLLATEKKNFKLEVWNYDRTPPEWDWCVPNAKKYVKDYKRIKHKVRLELEWPYKAPRAPYTRLNKK